MIPNVFGLPIEYRQVLSLSSTGTQHINTDYFPRTGDEITLECNIPSNGGGNWQGVRKYPNYAFGIGKNSRFFAQYSDVYHDGDSEIFPVGLRAKLTINKNGFYGATSNTSWSPITIKTWNAADAVSAYSFRLFSIYDTYSGGLVMRSFTDYSFQVKRDGGIIVDMIPCVRITDNVAGMYDLARSQFFVNNGTGDFIVTEL